AVSQHREPIPPHQSQCKRIIKHRSDSPQFFCFFLFCFSRGRFSVTKRCDQRGSKRTIAAKHVNKKLLCREQVLQEIRLLQTLDHPNLVRLLDTYETAHSYVLVLEMADQGRFLDYIVSWGNLTEEKVALYLRDILEALQYLHGWKVAHLDLKPENIVVEQVCSQPVIKLTDFGDAVQLDPHSSHIHPLLGSPEFSAPELVLAYACLPNVFAGVVTYVLLSGASPFLDESLEETCLNICRLDFSFPEDYFQGVSTEAKDFVCLLLQGELERRPSAGFCLQYPWLHHYGTHLDTSRLISFIERRKHQNDVRPVGAIQKTTRGATSSISFPLLNIFILFYCIPIQSYRNTFFLHHQQAIGQAKTKYSAFQILEKNNFFFSFEYAPNASFSVLLFFF
uniref:Protein kinase domain-containing protein n=1 Tax=Poecilia latipinna TaxID=48699 RepID=A0A3B3VSM0_9TELE